MVCNFLLTFVVLFKILFLFSFSEDMQSKLKFSFDAKHTHTPHPADMRPFKLFRVPEKWKIRVSSFKEILK